MAKVIVTPEAGAAFDALPRPIQLRMLYLFERLGHWPDVSGAKPLRKSLAGKYRIRTGDYRLQFSAVGDIVKVEKIGHRDRFYEE